jgi:3-isopropylmalate/(R)-2-methylmalate dehydratase large subunit
MGSTLVEKIVAAHSGRDAVRPGETVDLGIDCRAARDLGGAGVVRILRETGRGIADPVKTLFTFDCNPGGSDRKCAVDQGLCRAFAAAHGLRVFDLDRGIGAHAIVEEGLAWPGSTMVSTGSGAGVVGAVGALGLVLDEAGVAAAWGSGLVGFVVPPTVKVVFKGQPGPEAAARDLALAALRQLGTDGLAGSAAEFRGEAVEVLEFAGRITLTSLAAEAGAVAALIEPDERIVEFCHRRTRRETAALRADPDAVYAREVEVDVQGLGPLVARPGRAADAVAVEGLPPTRVDAVLIGSCANGRIKDLRAAAGVLRGRRAAPGVVLKIVPATNEVWRQCLSEGLFEVFMSAGALIGSPGCAGCAPGQIGQSAPDEVTVSTGSRGFRGAPAEGLVFLASPETAAASAAAGAITTAARLREGRCPARPERTAGAVARTP